MAWTSSKSTVGMGICALITVITVVLALRQIADLRAENERLRAEMAEAKTQKTATEEPLPAQVSAQELDRLKRDAAEVLRLRGQIAALRGEKADVAKLTEENARLRQRLQVAPTETRANTEQATPEEEAAKQAGIAKLNFTKQWAFAFRLYAQKNQGQMPADFNQAQSFLPQEFSSSLDPNQFEIVYHGTMQQIQDSKTIKPQDLIVLREREIVVGPNGRRSRAYSFADGHSEIRKEPPEGFEEFEKGRILTGQ